MSASEHVPWLYATAAVGLLTLYWIAVVWEPHIDQTYVHCPVLNWHLSQDCTVSFVYGPDKLLRCI